MQKQRRMQRRRRREERQTRTRRAAQRDECRTEPQRRRGAETKRRKGAEVQRRKGAKTKTGRVPCERKRKEASRNSDESAPRRVRVVSIATRTQPRRGVPLAPLTPLIRAAQARTCRTRAKFLKYF